MDDPKLMNMIRRNDKAEISRLRAALDAMTAERDAARAKALDDAAQVAHAELHFDGELATEVAAAIRAMIEQENNGQMTAAALVLLVVAIFLLTDPD